MSLSLLEYCEKYQNEKVTRELGDYLKQALKFSAVGDIIDECDFEVRYNTKFEHMFNVNTEKFQYIIFHESLRAESVIGLLDKEIESGVKVSDLHSKFKRLNPAFTERLFDALSSTGVEYLDLVEIATKVGHDISAKSRNGKRVDALDWYEYIEDPIRRYWRVAGYIPYQKIYIDRWHDSKWLEKLNAFISHGWPIEAFNSDIWPSIFYYSERTLVAKKKNDKSADVIETCTKIIVNGAHTLTETCLRQCIREQPSLLEEKNIFDAFYKKAPAKRFILQLSRSINASKSKINLPITKKLIRELKEEHMMDCLKAKQKSTVPLQQAIGVIERYVEKKNIP